MRAAEPDELKEYALPVMTARLSEAEFMKWFPIPFEEITDPWAAPEPSKGALAKLDSGECFVVYFGHDSRELTVRIAPNVDPATFMAAFLNEVPLLVSRVLWRRAEAPSAPPHEVVRPSQPHASFRWKSAAGKVARISVRKGKELIEDAVDNVEPAVKAIKKAAKTKVRAIKKSAAPVVKAVKKAARNAAKDALKASARQLRKAANKL